MHARARVRAVGAIAILLGTCPAAATAQIRTERLVSGAAPFRSDIATNIVGFQGIGTSFDVEASTELPVGLLIPKGLRPVLERMWQASPAFRRQCARLIDTSVSVTVSIGLPAATPAARAFTRIERRNGLVRYAYVYLNARLHRVHEVLAHELEHVLEQIDGVDLAGLSANGVHGVHRERGVFETARAAAIGRLVAHEVSRWRNEPDNEPASGTTATAAPPSAGS
jgi:hypothetical protein